MVITPRGWEWSVNVRDFAKTPGGDWLLRTKVVRDLMLRAAQVWVVSCGLAANYFYNRPGTYPIHVTCSNGAPSAGFSTPFKKVLGKQINRPLGRYGSALWLYQGSMTVHDGYTRYGWPIVESWPIGVDAEYRILVCISEWTAWLGTRGILCTAISFGYPMLPIGSLYSVMCRAMSFV